jgi:cardiolipin synthase
MPNADGTAVTLPNLITIARLIAVPVLVLLLINGAYAAAFALFVAAGISDAIDGAIARYVPGQASELGAYLDPVADKALLVAIFVTLGAIGYIPVWLVVLVVSRDLLIVGGVLLAWMMANPVSIDPLKVSKANTAAQILFAALVLAHLGFGWNLGAVVPTLSLVVAALTAGSAAAYLIAWVRHMGPSAGPSAGDGPRPPEH